MATAGKNHTIVSDFKNSVLVLAGMVGSIILWFVSKIIIVRNTTKEELGLYSLSVAVAGISSLISALGIPEGNSRYISIFFGEGRKDDAFAVSRASVGLGIVTAFSAGIILFFFSGIVAEHFFYMPAIEAPLKIISIFVPFSVLTNVLIGVSRGFNIVRPRIYSETLQPLLFLVFISVIFIFRGPFRGVIYAYALAMIIVFLLIARVYGFARFLINPVSLRHDAFAEQLLRFSMPLFMGGITAIFMNWTDIVMLGRYMGAESAAGYNIAMSLAKLLFFPISAFEFAFMSVAGNLYARKQYAELNRRYQVLTKWNFSATLPIFFILFFFPEMAIEFFFGRGYVDVAATTRILSIGFLFHSFLGANGTIMMVLGASRAVMKISMFSAVLNILMNYILIKHFHLGTGGAAVSTITSYVVMNIIMSAMIYREKGIHPITPHYIKPILSSAVIGLMIFALAKSLPLRLWMLPVYLTLYLAGYAVSLFATRSIEQEDIDLINAISEKTGLDLERIKKFIYKGARS
ncbi:MAG: flippase [Nitrospiraceae bacterium]|nr:flippase [Nitrospiraceae bacterium]